MIDINKPLREAFMAALDETITYDSTDIPAYHDQNPNEDENIYIILNTQTEEDISNKAKFFTTGTLLVDVVHKTDGITYDVVDTIAGEIMNILQPTPQTNGLTDPSGLQIINLRKLSSTPLTIPSPEGNVMRRLLRYEYKVAEN